MPFDTQTTRMPNGLTNAAPWQTMGASGIPDPSWAHVYHNDFDTFATGDWTITKVGTGTTALAAVDGGQLLLTNTAGATDAIYMQPVVATYKLLANTDTFYKFAGVLSDVTNCQFFAGLIATSTTPLSAADGVWIQMAAGGALTLKSVIGGVTTSQALPAAYNLVAGTPFELGIHVDYLGNVEAFINPTTGSSFVYPGQSGVRGRNAALYAPGVTQVLLAPSFGLLNASAATRSLGVDYVTAVRDR